MKVNLVHSESRAILDRLAGSAINQEVSSLLNGMSVGEVLLRLLEKDASPTPLPPGIGLDLASIRQAKAGVDKISSARRNGASAKAVLVAVEERKTLRNNARKDEERRRASRGKPF